MTTTVNWRDMREGWEERATEFGSEQEANIFVEGLRQTERTYVENVITDRRSEVEERCGVRLR